MVTTIAVKMTSVALKAVLKTDENENDDIDSGDRDEFMVVILVFINGEEAVERPAITHLGKANNTIAINMPSVLTTSVHKHVSTRAAILEITRRSEIYFSIFDSSTNSVKTCLINTKLGNLVNLGVLFLTVWTNSC